jgi:hypothetical protein
MYYDIDFTALVRSLVPVRLRNMVQLSWLRCLVQPVVELYARFCSNRTDNLYTLRHNSQVVYLQAALNDTFDPSGRGIYIGDAYSAVPQYTYLNAESRPEWLSLRGETGITTYGYPAWLPTRTETILSTYDFIVHIPISVSYDPVRMAALIDKYRLASKNHYTFLNY